MCAGSLCGDFPPGLALTVTISRQIPLAPLILERVIILRITAYFLSMIKHLTITTPGQGLQEFTDRLTALVQEVGVQEGLCTLFIQHSSASLLIQENADPAVRRDLEQWFARLVPEDEALYTHRNEGPDDMPGHIRSALTATHLAIPICEGRLALGTWQGVFLWEHKRGGRARHIVVHIGE